MYPAPDKVYRSFYVFSDDINLANTRRCYWLHQVLPRLKMRSFWRDTTDARDSLKVLNVEELSKHRGVEGFVIGTKLTEMAMFGWIDAVLSPDCDWYFPHTCFSTYQGTKTLISWWSTDILSNIRRATYEFSAIPDELTLPKNYHFFPSPARLKEGEILALPNTHLLRHAAPNEYLEIEIEPQIKDRLAYIGNPHFPISANSQAIPLLKNGSLEDVRTIALEEILQYETMSAWEKEIPNIRDFIKSAAQAKLLSPYQSTLSIIESLKTSHSIVLDYRSKLSLELCELISSVLKYDQPFTIAQLQQKNLVTVYGDRLMWSNCGISSEPHIRWNELPQITARHLAHLHLPNFRNETELEEELFISGALGRVSFGLNTPDSAFLEEQCYLSEDAASLASLIQEHLKTPEKLLQDGAQTREWIRNGHTLDHRIHSLLEVLTT